MFRKKYQTKDTQALGKSDVKKLKQRAESMLPSELVELLFSKKITVQRRRFHFAGNVNAFLLLFNGVPFFAQICSVLEDGHALFSSGAMNFPDILLPTVFLFLYARQNEAALPFEDVITKWRAGGTGVVCECYAPTSKFIISGAHLMTPGILRITPSENCFPKAPALVCSLGNPIPYAVGIITETLTEGNGTGIGVYVVNAFKDNMWDEFVTVFLAFCGPPKTDDGIIPSTFSDNEIQGNYTLPGGSTDAANQDEISNTEQPDAAPSDAVPTETLEEEVVETNDINANKSEEAEPEEEEEEEAGNERHHVDTQVNDDYSTLFPSEDAILDFALCECLKKVTNSMLPLPITQFVSILSNQYPRCNDFAPIDFKQTPYKKALAYLSQRTECVTISEVSEGVHQVVALNKALVRAHNVTFQKFLDEVQYPSQHKEQQELEAQLMNDPKAQFQQKILTASLVYRPHRDIPDELAEVLLCGNMEAGVSALTFPSLQEVFEGAKKRTDAEMTASNNNDDDNNAIGRSDYMHELYTQKHIGDNLREYIRVHSLITAPGEKGKMPDVTLKHALSCFAKSDITVLSLDKLQSMIFKFFSTMHLVVIQTSVQGASQSSAFDPKEILKNGELPKVNIWEEKRSGNKHITIVKFIDRLGFNVRYLCTNWRQTFSTSCSVYDPAVDMKNLKSGTKVFVEIHLQGKFVSRLEQVLVKDHGIPASCIVKAKP